MYQPNFCCECGNKLIRLRWHFWTSRRFCNFCARRFRRERLVPLFLISLALITSGYLLGRTRQERRPPLIIERRSDSPLNDSQFSRQRLLDQFNFRNTCYHNREYDRGRRLHLWRAHKKGNALLAARTWTSALLATQRNARHAASGKTAGARMTGLVTHDITVVFENRSFTHQIFNGYTHVRILGAIALQV